MINLIPPGKRRIIEKDYTRRVASLYMLFLAIAVAIGIVLLLPSYFLVNTESVGAENELLTLQGSSESTEREEVNEKLELAQKRLQALTRETSPIQLTELLEILSTHSSNEIEISNITYLRGENQSTSTLNVGGNAKTRDSLLEFGKQLETEDVIYEASVPVRYLAGEFDIDFIIEIKGIF